MNKTHAKEFLFNLIDIFEKYNIRYCIVDGVCLGAVRENDFIKWDKDIDIAVFEQFWCDFHKMQDILKELDKKEITITNCWNNTIITFKKYNITANISYIMKNMKEYYKYNNMGKWVIPRLCFDILLEREFLGRRIYFPSYIKDYLTCEYGKNWKTPLSNEEYKYYNFEKWKIKKRAVIRTVFTYGK